METMENSKPVESENIEDGFRQLEQIIKTMEGGNQSLEEAFASYQTGINLVRQLDASLTDIEKKLEIFNKQTGEFELQDE